MSIKYSISGGQLKIDKKVFAKEMLLSNSVLKKILKTNVCLDRQPAAVKKDNYVYINYNRADDIELDENFEDIFKDLKKKYKDKIRGKITMKIYLLSSYYVVLDLDSDDNEVKYKRID